MTKREVQEEILRLKKQNGVCIMAHSYMRYDVLEIADFSGDSYALAKRAASLEEQTVLLCGVRFMAETVKILAPSKRVLLSEKNAGCPMAEQLSAEKLKELKLLYPNAVTAAYVNTTAQLKALSDVCVTSSSAVRVLAGLKEEEILFVPDLQLGRYVEKQLPQKKFHFFEGGCPVHFRATGEDVLKMRRALPGALLLAHPECRAEVSQNADFVGSTSDIIAFAKASGHKQFIIATESAIAEYLQHVCPGKQFYPLAENFICSDMKLTTLSSVLACLQGRGGEEITLEEDTRLAAKGCIDRMIALGG